MAKIILDVSDKELETVVTILQNLKEGLIVTMQVDGKCSEPKSAIRQRETRYQPKRAKIVHEEEQLELKKEGKYLSPAEFKRKLKRS